MLVLGVLCCCGGRLSEKGGGTETRGEAYMLKGAPLPHLKNTGCHVPLVFIDQKRKVKVPRDSQKSDKFLGLGLGAVYVSQDDLSSSTPQISHRP